MERPFKFIIICNKTGEVVRETNIEPMLHELQTWENTNNPKEKILKQTKTVYIDTRYEVKLRLYNYVTYKRNGLKVPEYNPYENSEIGKTIPILNF